MLHQFSTLGLILVTVLSTNIQSSRCDRSATTTVWPQPRIFRTHHKQYEIRPNQFFFKTNSTCDIVLKAIGRYYNLIFSRKNTVRVSEPKSKLLKYLRVELGHSEDCGYPQDGMDEKYFLNITSKDAVLSASAPWGILRGLETFSQLTYFDEDANSYFVNLCLIRDWPRFGFRGLLLDSSRHFLPVKVLKQNLDAMAFNKFNVFHWHIVDDPSWPLQMEKYDNLTDAAYHPRLVYSQQDVKDIIEYARLRGIRVLPEIDTPGHTASLGRILPEILTPCKHGRAVLNVARNYTYEVVASIVGEIKDLFVDRFVHLGMDEVDYTCWKNSPEVSEFMAKEKLVTYPQVEQYYVRETLNNIRRLGYQYIIWQDPINNGVKPPADTVVGVWLDYYSQPNKTKHGYKIILSTPWYLNYINYGEDWQRYYLVEPTDFPATKPESELIIGGEACMWGEFVDATNVFPRTWPRASAVAERLWSSKSVNDTDDARIRLDMQHCRMRRRGLPAQPIKVGYCDGFEAEN